MKIIFITFIIFSTLFAHKLNVFLFEENKNLIVSSYFASGAYCKNCKVEFYNLEKKLIKEGKTDEKGEYLIEIPKETLEIKVEAIGGHAAFARFDVDNKNIKKEKIEIKSTKDSLLQSFIAILLIAGIFLFLKRIKKTKELNNV